YEHTRCDFCSSLCTSVKSIANADAPCSKTTVGEPWPVHNRCIRLPPPMSNSFPGAGGSSCCAASAAVRQQARKLDRSKLMRTAPPSFRLLQCRQHRVDRFLRVAEQHPRVVFIEERIVDAGIAARHAALHDHADLGLPDLEDWHAVNRR